jgi:hypothetical protein
MAVAGDNFKNRAPIPLALAMTYVYLRFDPNKNEASVFSSFFFFTITNEVVRVASIL